IKETFVLFDTKVDAEYFTALVFDIKKIQMNKSKLMSDAESLSFAQFWLEKTKNYMEEKKEFLYFDLMKLITARSCNYKTYLMDGSFVKSEKVYKIDPIVKRENDYILSKCLLESRERHKYEEDALKSFEGIEDVVQNKER